MEKYRRQKMIIIIALIITIAGLSIGFAAFSEIFKISSTASVTPNASTFSVKFSTKQDSLDESEIVASSVTDGLEYTNGVIDNSGSPTASNMSATFTTPGQYVEYTFYARNEGEYKAYLNNVNFVGTKTCTGVEEATDSLVQSACESINMTVTVGDSTYSQTTAIMGHALEKDAGEKVIVNISYASDGAMADGEFSVDFGKIRMVYSTIDDSTFDPPIIYGDEVGTVNYTMKSVAVSDSSVDFSSSPTAGVYILSGTEKSSNPIYYYRGAVTNNNVLFADFCWKIVRTTETGGIKLVYNGVPASDGSCANTGTASQLSSTSAFNSSYKSPADVGYMYGTRYEYGSQSLSSQSETYLYGNTVTWDGTNYTLNDTYSSSSWTNDKATLATKYHYTCFDSDGSCTSVYYIHYFGNSSTAYYLTLTDGKDIEDAKDEMFTNTTNSTIKAVIDNWYASNMTDYTDMLEDTVWCNDRTITSGSLAGESVDAGTGYSYFGAYLRNVTNKAPSVTCSNTNDSFTVSSSNGNGALTYPVGLLTADEMTMAGSGNSGYSTSAYLYTGQAQWSLSPSYFSNYYAGGFYLNSSGQLYDTYSVSSTYGVRPSVSLIPGTQIVSGDGTTTSPYIMG